MRYFLGLGLMLVVSACGGGGDSGIKGPPPIAAGPCATPSGTYFAHYEVLSGDCGMVADQLINLDGAAAVESSSCTINSNSVSDSGCRADTDMNCVINGVSEHITEIDEANDNASTRITATISIQAAGHCAGTYRATLTKQ